MRRLRKLELRVAQTTEQFEAERVRREELEAQCTARRTEAPDITRGLERARHDVEVMQKEFDYRRGASNGEILRVRACSVWRPRLPREIGSPRLPREIGYLVCPER